MKLKVLQLITWLNRGGIEKWLLEMLREIPRADCEIDFFCKGQRIGDLAPQAKELGARFFHTPLTPSHVSFARGLKSAIVGGRYDILHNHLETYSGLPVWIGYKAGVPIISSFHNIEFKAQTWTRIPVIKQLRWVYGELSINYAIKHSDVVTGCSQSVLDVLYKGNVAQNAQVLHYGIDKPKAASEEDRVNLLQSLKWPNDSRIVLHVGSFKKQKNHERLLEIFALIVKSVPSAKLLLIGDGPLVPRVQDKLASLGLSSSVRLLGSRDDVSELMSLSDVFLFPSLFEGFGLAALEANAAGLPVVGSKIEGLSEAVEDGTTALLHDVDDVLGMAKSVIRLLHDREFAEALGTAGRRRYERGFTRAASARSLLGLYRRCIRSQ